MNTRKPRFYIPDELYKTYCEDPKPIWNNIFTTLVMVFTGISATTFEPDEYNGCRIPKIIMWLIICVCSIVHQGCIYPQYLWVSRLDSLATITNMTLYVLTFYETAPWWVWVIVASTILVFIYYYYRFYADPPISMIQYCRLVNLWHVGTTAVVISCYATAGLSQESPGK